MREYEIVEHLKLEDLNIFLVELSYRSPHMHKEFEIGMVLSGSVMVCANQKNERFDPGDMMIFNPHQSHELHAYTIPSVLSLTSVSSILNFLTRDNGWTISRFIPAAVGMIIYLWYEYGFGKKFRLDHCLASKRGYVRWITYTVLILATLYFGSTLAQSDFVYFRF